MTFDEITQQFEHSPNGSGTDAFLAVKDATCDLMCGDPPNAVIYFLIYDFARSHVVLHDDEPISTESANESRQQLLDYMKRLNAALTRDEPGLLATASAVINDYMRSKQRQRSPLLDEIGRLADNVSIDGNQGTSWSTSRRMTSFAGYATTSSSCITSRKHR